MLRKKLAFIIVFLFVSAGVVSGFNINPDNEPKVVMELEIILLFKVR